MAMLPVMPRLAVVATAVLICRLAVSLILIPPWQMADEQAHVAVTEFWRSRQLGMHSTDPGRQVEIIESMVRHEWWPYYGISNPVPPLPTHFIEAPAFATIGIEPPGSFARFFYQTMAAGLSLVPGTTVTTDLYIMRAFSAVLAVLTLWVAWAGARAALGDSMATLVVTLLALHPQFVIASTSAGPDALVNLAAAVVWWQAATALRHGHAVMPLLVIWSLAIVAAVIDRMGVSLLALAAVASVAIVAPSGFRPRTLAILALAVALVALAFSNEGVRAGVRNAMGVRWLPVDDARTWDFFWTFHRVLFTSWWFSLGWARFLPPWWWVVLAGALSAVIAFGLARMFTVERQIAPVVKLAAAMCAVQLAGLYWVYYRSAVGPQGRHAFPVLIPTLILICLAWDRVVPPSRRPRARVALVAAVVALDAAGWLFLAIPVYGRGARAESHTPVLSGRKMETFRRMQTPEITEGVHVGELFNMYEDGLTAIQLRPVRVGEPRGKVRLRIAIGSSPAPASVRTAEIPAADFVRTGTFLFRFAPYPRSKNQQFVLDVASSADEPSSGVALWANKGEGKGEDVLLFNDEARFGDLVYQTEIVPPLPVRTAPLRRAVWYALGLLAFAWLMVPRLMRATYHAVS